MKRLPAVMLGALAAGASLCAAPGAWAQSLVNARVLAVAPVYESVPVTQCAPAYGQTSGAGAFVGSVLGAVVGSQFGSGGGHFAGAAVGALGGALLGNAAEAQQGAYAGCHTVYQQRLTGYDVSYELGGQTWQTRTAQAPGAWITVPVAAGDAAPGAQPVQTYPVTHPPMAQYPLPAPAPVVTAPPAYASAYPSADDAAAAPAYPQPYTTPVGVPVRPAPVYMAPVFVAPVGVNLSVGGGWGRHGRGGWGLGVGW